MRRNTTGQTSRRTVLRGIGATGLTIGIGTGIGAAKPDTNRGNGAKNRLERGQDRKPNHPGHKDFECPEGMEHLGTFEFVTVEDDEGNVIDCYFEQSEGDTDLVTITEYENKAGEDCEPITVTYESETHTVGQVASFGGMDTHVDDEPADGVYESDLENPGGQQAAISLLHFCGTLTEDETADDGDVETL